MRSQEMQATARSKQATSAITFELNYQWHIVTNNDNTFLA